VVPESPASPGNFSDRGEKEIVGSRRCPNYGFIIPLDSGKRVLVLPPPYVHYRLKNQLSISFAAETCNLADEAGSNVIAHPVAQALTCPFNLILPSTRSDNRRCLLVFLGAQAGK
jgi:hypothetical protein